MLNFKPRAVLLDAGFTLTFLDGARVAALTAPVGLIVAPDAVEAAELELRRETARDVRLVIPVVQKASVPTPAPRFYRRLLELASSRAEDHLLDEAADAIWTAHLRNNLWCRVGRGVDAALRRLRGAGIKLAVVSNSEGTVAAMLNQVGLARHLELVVDSWVVGFEKPDPRIFGVALDHLGIAPHEAVMVGDTPAADVAGAQAAGVAAVLIDPLDLYPAAGVPRFTDVPAFVDDLLDDLLGAPPGDLPDAGAGPFDP